jgi:hypothetical protein
LADDRRAAWHRKIRREFLMSRVPSVEAWPGGEPQKSAVLAGRYADVAAGRVQDMGWEYLAGPASDWRGDDTGCLLVHLYGFDEAARIVGSGSAEDPRDVVSAALGWPTEYYEWRGEACERLGPQVRVEWATRSLEVIPVGADLRVVVDRLVCDVLSDDAEIGVQRYVTGPAVDALDMVHGIYRRWLDGRGEPTLDELQAASTAIPAPFTAGTYIALQALKSAAAGGWTLNILLKAVQLAGSGADAYMSAFADRIIAYTEELPSAPPMTSRS